MKTTVLMAGLVAALAGTAVLAQVAANPDEVAPAGPEATAPVAPAAVPDGAVPELAGCGDGPGLGPMGGMGRGGDVPNMGPLSIEALDTDGDGGVTPEEVEARKAARFAQADADGDGGLSAEELVALEDIVRDEMRAVRAAAQVQTMDDDGDGLLQAAEIEARTPRIQPVFDRLDADDDGAITRAELDAARPARGEGPDGGRGSRG
jgi:hypothetical protein